MNFAQWGFKLSDINRLNNFIKSSSQNSLLEWTIVIVLILPKAIILHLLSSLLSRSTNLYKTLLLLLFILLLLVLLVHRSNSSLSIAATDLYDHALWLDITIEFREWVGCFRVIDCIIYRNVLKFACEIRASAIFDEFRAIQFIGHFFINSLF
jgi:hypothetical protein